MKQRDPLCPSQVATAADSLAVLLPILHAFNYRHRNQHRVSNWWASFGLLRRALGRLADCLLPLHVEATPSASGVTLGHRVTLSHHHVAARARWLKSHVIPSAYVTFSQLAADNQHAPLGILLLAILARTHAVLAHISPSETSPVLPLIAPTKPTKPLQSSSSVAEPSAADHGVVVSREELLQIDSQPSHGPPEIVHTTTRTCDAKSAKEQPKIRRSKTKKRGKNRDRDALSSLFSALD